MAREQYWQKLMELNPRFKYQGQIEMGPQKFRAFFDQVWDRAEEHGRETAKAGTPPVPDFLQNIFGGGR